MGIDWLKSTVNSQILSSNIRTKSETLAALSVKLMLCSSGLSHDVYIPLVALNRALPLHVIVLAKKGESLVHFDHMLNVVGCGYHFVVDFACALRLWLRCFLWRWLSQTINDHTAIELGSTNSLTQDTVLQLVSLTRNFFGLELLDWNSWIGTGRNINTAHSNISSSGV